MSDFDSKFQHLSNFESKVLQSLKFCLMKFKKSQTLSWKLQKVSIFGKSCIQKLTWITLFRKMDIFCPICASVKALFWEKKTVCIVSDLSRTKSEWKQCTWKTDFHGRNRNLSDSGLKVLQSVKPWNEEISTCQILTWKF